MEAIKKGEKECLPQIMAANALLMPHGMRIAAIAVVPEFMEDVQRQVLQAERDGALNDLKGMAFVPYYPETMKLKQVQGQVGSITQFLSYVSQHNLDIDRASIASGDSTRHVLASLGVDIDKLKEEQAAVQKRIELYKDKLGKTEEAFGKVEVKS